MVVVLVRCAKYSVHVYLYQFVMQSSLASRYMCVYFIRACCAICTYHRNDRNDDATDATLHITIISKHEQKNTHIFHTSHIGVLFFSRIHIYPK